MGQIWRAGFNPSWKPKQGLKLEKWMYKLLYVHIVCHYITYIYNIIYIGGWSKHSCRCVIRNDLAPALALPCALQGFYCVPLHRLKYVFRNWLPQKVAQFKGVFTDPVRCATQTFLDFGSKIWWFGARILRSWRFWGVLPTEEIWFPKRPFWARKQLYGNHFKRYVEGECIHVGNLIPKTAISSQKAALRESNLKRYGRRQIYTHRNCDSQNGPLEPKSNFTGIKIQEELDFDSQNGPFEPESSFTGIKFQEVL